MKYIPLLPIVIMIISGAAQAQTISHYSGRDYSLQLLIPSGPQDICRSGFNNVTLESTNPFDPQHGTYTIHYYIIDNDSIETEASEIVPASEVTRARIANYLIARERVWVQNFVNDPTRTPCTVVRVTRLWANNVEYGWYHRLQ